jgi:hypothetical protein
MDRNLLHLPVLTSHYLAAIWVSVYCKWWSMLNIRSIGYSLPVVFAAYVFVTAVPNLQVLLSWMLAFPAYSLLQVLVMPPVGAAYYFVLAWRRGRLGRYGFGYRRRRPGLDEHHRSLFPVAVV